MFAIQLGLVDLCRELIRYGGDFNVQLNDGASAAFLASQSGNLDLLRLLAATGANLGLVRNVGDSRFKKPNIIKQDN